jgi:formate/nitrite transporter FocA (FNT family)
MFTTVAAIQRRISIVKMLIHWTITFFGNLAGSLFIVAIITGYGGVFDSAGYKAEAISFATTKQVTPAWHMIFLRAIGANWLVCLACYLGMIGRDLSSKIVGIWWPTFGFVSLGLDVSSTCLLRHRKHRR